MNENLTKTENVIDKMIENKFFVLITIFVFLLLSIIFTGFQKREYSSEAKVLIIQEQSQTIDAYVASKASESIAKDFKKAVESSSFRNTVLENSFGVDFGLSSNDEKTRRKQWQKTVDVKLLPNTAIIQITTYSVSQTEAEKLLNTIMTSLFQNHKEYHGGGDTIQLQIIDYPLTSKYPTRPNWLLNISLTLALALFLTGSICSLFPNKIEKMSDLFDSKKYSKNKPEIKKVFEEARHGDRNNTININQYLNDTKNEIKELEKNQINKHDKFQSKEDPIQNIMGSDHYLRRKE